MSDIREKFEYSSEMVTHDRVITRANELGVSGWELVGVYPVMVHVSGPFSHQEETKFECIFKRKILKPTQYLSMDVCAGPDKCSEPGHGHPVG